MARTQSSHCGGPGFNPGQGIKIPQAVWYMARKNVRVLTLYILLNLSKTEVDSEIDMLAA